MLLYSIIDLISILYFYSCVFSLLQGHFYWLTFDLSQTWKQYIQPLSSHSCPNVNSLPLGLCFLYSLEKAFLQDISKGWENPYFQPAKITFKTVSHSLFQISLLSLQRQIVPPSSATQQKHYQWYKVSFFFSRKFLTHRGPSHKSPS